MTKKKILCVIAAAALISALICGLLYWNSVKKYRDAVAAMTWKDVALESVADGIYTGACDVDFIYAKVSVAVKNGRVQEIDLLEHRNGRGAPAEEITERMIQMQSLNVDAVSGATNSSKVIRKAVENALTTDLR